MIAHLSGTLFSKISSKIIVDVSGVGYELEVPVSTLSAMPDLNQQVLVYVQMIVREDAQLLYGFATLSEKSSFNVLIKINGVGPKMALAILSTMSSQELAHAVHESNTTSLVKIPGVGKKTAERLIVELKDKLSVFESEVNTSKELNSTENEAISALESLGYKHSDASKLVKSVLKESDVVEDIIRLALRSNTK